MTSHQTAAERRQKTARLTEQGQSIPAIASALGVDRRTVSRDRATIGAAPPPIARIKSEHGIYENNPSAKSIPSAWRGPIASWYQELHSRGLRERTKTLYISLIRSLARGLGGSPYQVAGETLIHYTATKDWKPGTRASHYICMDQFFEHLHGVGNPNPAAVLVKPRKPHTEPRPCPEDVILAGLRNARTAEQRAMILLAATMGLRVGEIVIVQVEDFEQTTSGSRLRIDGKGGRIRYVPASLEVQSVLSEMELPDSGYIFLDPSTGKHLSPQRLSHRLSALLPGKWTAHTLRHRFATKAYSADQDLLTLQRLLGHSSVATTQRYAQPPEIGVANAMQAASLGAL